MLQLSVEIIQAEMSITLPQTPHSDPPTSMTLIQSTKVPGCPIAVHFHNNKIYGGSESTSSLLELDESLGGPRTLINMTKDATSVQIYKKEIYVWLAKGELIHVYDINGKFVRSWKHFCQSKSYNKLRVVSDMLVVSSAQDQALTVYDLQGQIVKQIKCPGISISNNWRAMAVCGNDSVIVSDYNTKSVCRVNIDSGEVMWTSKHVHLPEGVVCYKNRYVLVTNRNTDTRIWILDAETGRYACCQTIIN